MAFDPSIHAVRRQRFLEHLGEAAAVIPAAPLATHHADCEWPFRQDSDFFYLTGFDEPDAVALLLPKAERRRGRRFGRLLGVPRGPLQHASEAQSRLEKVRDRHLERALVEF